MCAYTMKAGWKVGQASHGAYYGNKAAFHFLGKTTTAAEVPGTQCGMSARLMTENTYLHSPVAGKCSMIPFGCIPNRNDAFDLSLSFSVDPLINCFRPTFWLCCLWVMLRILKKISITVVHHCNKESYIMWNRRSLWLLFLDISIEFLRIGS